MVKYLYAVSGSWPRGPHSLEELRLLKEDGKLTDDTLVTEEHAERWGKLGVLLGTLAPEPEQAGPKAPLAQTASAHLAQRYLGGGLSWFLLTLGQVAALLACVAILVGMMQQLARLSEAEKLVRQTQRAGDPWVLQATSALQASRTWVLIGGILSLCLSAALFIVFKRAKSAADVATSQDAENERLWQALAEIRSAMRARST